MNEVGLYADYLVAINVCPEKESEELRVLGRRIIYLSYKHDPDGFNDLICQDLGDVDSHKKVLGLLKKIYQEND